MIPTTGSRTTLALEPEELEALIAELEATYEGRDDAPALRRRLLAQLPDIPSTWVHRTRLTLIGVEQLIHDEGAGRAAQIVTEIRDRADASSHRPLQARATRALSWLFRKIGDPSVAVEHAVAGLTLDGDDLGAVLRCRLRLVMADALTESGAVAEARPRYREALEHARFLITPWLSMLVVNNWAWAELVAGDVDASVALVDQMEAAARQHGVPLTLVAAGTVADVLHASGRSTEAVTMLNARLREDRRDAPICSAGCWLTLAHIQLAVGDLDGAGASLATADQLVEAHAIHVLEVEAIGARAELLAARGDHAGAYETHLRFHARTLELRSAASDARAQTQHAMYEADTARRDSARYRQMSYRDPLTGLFNRRHVDSDLDTRLTRGDALAVAMVDLDHFKNVNDTCSHEAGDHVLVRLAELLRDAASTASPHAYAARLGGEEFLLVLPGHDLPRAHAVAETLRATINATDWTDIAPGVPITASTGLATTSHSARLPLDRADLLRRADHHLYAAKAGGRDRVEPTGPCEAGDAHDTGAPGPRGVSRSPGPS